MRLQFVTFVTVGLVNTAIGLAVISGCIYFLNLPALAANAVGYAAGIIISFKLNGTFTFRYSAISTASFVRFLIVFGLAYLANAGVVLALTSWNRYLAQAAGLFTYTVLSFTGCRVFVFRRPDETRSV